jgi:hypothetical protein
LIATETDQQAAQDFCRAHNLPLSGYVLFLGGKPFRWEPLYPPNPQAVTTGTVAVAVDSESRYVARGSLQEAGERWWERED